MEVYNDMRRTGGDATVSDAYTINGQPETFKLRVDYGKTYLLRMVNAALQDILFFAIAKHQLTVVGTDGNYVKPLKVDYLTISPGQTMDVLLEANQSPLDHYYMAAKVYSSAIGVPFDNTTTTAIVQYIRENTFHLQAPLHCLYFQVLGPNGNRLSASMNNISFEMPPQNNILQAYYNNISGVFGENFPNVPPLMFDFTANNLPTFLNTPSVDTEVNVLEYNSTVEIVLQGTNLLAGTEHPIHLHGYSFYVVGWGFGNFDKDKDPLKYNLVDPPYQNTVSIPKNGWTAIRFRANNPGVWFMHCHLERHVTWGMAMTFIVKNGNNPEEQMLPPPPDMPRC
ncbi:Multicopper oxidase, type 1 [Sesbania bispinosa]|nr:Multicopper oxidase, type 1 [Sesbania bispinosa]